MENEFMRVKPQAKNQNVWLDIGGYVVPAVLFIAGLYVSTQAFAQVMNYDVKIVRNPILIVQGYRIYNPAIYILCFIKYSLQPVFYPYFSATIIYTIVGSVLAILSLILFAVIRGYKNKGDNLYGTARYAKESELEEFGLACQDSGVVLGQYARAHVENYYKDGSMILHHKRGAPLLCHKGTTNTLLIAPTRSGKGVGLIIPTLLSWLGSTIVFDPKGENYNITSGWRREFSTVLKFSPLDPDGNTVRFNPLREIRGNKQAYGDTDLISETLFPKGSGGGNEEFFNNSARDLLNTVIMHVRFSPEYAVSQKNMATVLEVLSNATDETGSEEDEYDATQRLFMMMKECVHVGDDGQIDEEVNKKVKSGAGRIIQMDAKVRSSVFSTAFSKIAIFDDPAVSYATQDSDFTVLDFVKAKNPISLYLTVSFAQIERISVVFRLLIMFIVKKLSDGETQAGEIKLQNKLLFLLDEFAALGKFDFIEMIMGQVAGYGITFFLAVQALNQIVKLYGKEHAFLDHCKTTVIYAPGKIEDAKLFTDSIGKESVVHDTISSSGRRTDTMFSNLSLSSQEIARDLLNPDELLKLPANQLLLFNQGLPPYIGKKICYYEDERFKNKAQMPTAVTREAIVSEATTLPSFAETMKQNEVYRKLHEQKKEVQETADYRVSISEQSYDECPSELEDESANGIGGVV